MSGFSRNILKEIVLIVLLVSFGIPAVGRLREVIFSRADREKINWSCWPCQMRSAFLLTAFCFVNSKSFHCSSSRQPLTHTVGFAIGLVCSFGKSDHSVFRAPRLPEAIKKRMQECRGCMIANIINALTENSWTHFGRHPLLYDRLRNGHAEKK